MRDYINSNVIAAHITDENGVPAAVDIVDHFRKSLIGKRPAAPSVIGEIQDQTYAVGSDAYTIDLSTCFSGASSYTVAPMPAGVSLAGAILSFSPITAVATTVMTVRGLHLGVQSALIVFSLTVTAREVEAPEPEPQIPEVVTPPQIAAGPYGLGAVIRGDAGVYSNSPSAVARHWMIRDAASQAWSQIVDATDLSVGVTTLMAGYDRIRIDERPSNAAGAADWVSSNEAVLDVQADTDPPVLPAIEGKTFDPAENLLTFSVNKPVTLYGVHTTEHAPMSAENIESNAELVRALAAGVNYLDWSDDLWGYGDFWLHCMVRDADGNTQVLAPIAHSRINPVFREDWSIFAAGSLPRGTGQRYANGSSGSTGAEITAENFLRMSGSTASSRWVYDTVSAAALALRTDETVRIYMRIANLATVSTRGGIGFNTTVDEFYGLSIQYDTAASLTRYRALRGASLNTSNGGTEVLAAAAGTPVDVLMEISSSTIKFKAWPVGSAEPENWVELENSHAGEPIPWGRLDFTTRTTAANYLVHGWSLGIGAPAERIFA